MGSVPDKISIKRRRDEEPVDTLGQYSYGAKDRNSRCVVFAKNKKQRTTDDIFVRLRSEDGRPLITSLTKPTTITPEVSTSNSSRSVIPEIRTTQPGDEVKDFEKYKAAQNAKLNSPPAPTLQQVSSQKSKPLTEIDSSLSLTSSQARQFHLTRDLSTTLRPQSSGGIRKSKSLRPHLPTFIERLETVAKQHSSIYAKPPIDRIIKSINQSDHEVELQRILSSNGNVPKADIQSFQKPISNVSRTGRSIRDDPATWDLRSDQLADELLALALDMDPEAKEAYKQELNQNSHNTVIASHNLQSYLDQPDDYIFETYVRVQKNALQDTDHFSHPATFGYLVIDDTEEDLWQQYLREEDEDSDDWDEEDEDSNGRTMYTPSSTIC